MANPLDKISTIAEKVNQKEFRVHDFPYHVFPQRFKDFIEDVTTTTDSLPDHLGTAVLTVAAAAIGNAYELQIKPGWKCKPILFSANVGPSGRSKTVGAKKAMHPIKAREMDYKKQYDEAKKTWERERADAEMNKQPIPPEPVAKRLFLANVTPEKIHVVHEHNDKGLIIFRDELSGFLKSMNKYRKGDDDEFFMELYDGNPAPIDRIGRDTLYVSNPCVSITGGMTPGNIEEIASGGRSENGFMQRFIYAYPEKKELGEMPLEGQNMDILRDYNRSVEKLIDLPMAEDESGKIPNLIILSKEAFKTWLAWANDNRKQINKAKVDFLESVFSKFQETVCRISLVIEAMRFASNTSNLYEVSKEAMEAAITLIEYYRSTAIKVFNEMQEVQLTMEKQQPKNEYYSVQWPLIFKDDKKLTTGEITERLQAVFPTMSERTTRTYMARHLEPIKRGSWGMKEDTPKK